MKVNLKKILLAFVFIIVNQLVAQQNTGIYKSMDGGFEGQVVGQVPNTSSSSVPTSNWSRSSATGTAPIRSISNTNSRTGSNYVSISNSSTTGSTNLLSPYVLGGKIIGGSSYVIQFYYRATDLTTLPNGNITVGASNAARTAVTNTAWAPNVTTNNAVWLKSVNVVVAATGAIQDTGYSVFRIASNAANNGKGIDIDDWVMYPGTVADITPPADPNVASVSNPTNSTLNVSWVPSSNVDSGGYLVVRYTTDPSLTPQADPNINGVYNVGNALGNGVVAYTGTSTTFIDKLLNTNTQYWYRVYTVDKAFNYSNAVSASGSTNNTVAVSNYYIDATNGDDSNDGSSPVTAWKTITKVNATTFVAGDSILFKCGEVWTGSTLAPKGSGVSNKKIVVSKYGVGALPKIEADGNGLHNENGVYLFNQEYITISDLEITNNYAKTKTDTVIRKGVYVLANNKGTVKGITLRNLVIHDVLGTYDLSNESGGIFCNITGTSIVTRFDSLLIENCKVYNVDKIGISNQSTWDGRDLNGDYGSTPWRPSTNYIIRNCEVDSSGGNGMIIRDAKAPLVEYCYIYKCGKRYSGNGLFTFNCDDALIQYNESAFTVYNPGDVDASGFDGDYRCKRTTFQYNYSHDNDGGFAVVVCQPGGTPARFNDSCVFRYNISQNDGHFNGGVNNEGQIFSITGLATNTFIYNNTIYSSNDFNYTIIHRRWGDAGTVWPDNTNYFNNIFYMNKANPSYAFQSSTGNTFDYNVFYQPLGGSNPIDPHASNANPLFVNGGSGTFGLNSLAGYKLQQTSPAINNGKVITGAPAKDFFGIAVPTGSGVDRGACEYTIIVPVKLGMFRGENINGTNKLTWNTFTEINNDFFIVEKSNNGAEFSSIGKIYSNSISGNSNFPLNYNFIDEKPFERVSYYRLKQVDKNGAFTYSSIIKIETRSSKNISLEIYPNPIINNDITLNCVGFDKGAYDISIINALGQIVVNKKIEIISEKFTLTNLQLVKGSYRLTIKNTNVDITKSIIVQQ